MQAKWSVAAAIFSGTCQPCGSTRAIGPASIAQSNASGEAIWRGAGHRIARRGTEGRRQSARRASRESAELCFKPAVFHLQPLAKESWQSR